MILLIFGIREQLLNVSAVLILIQVDIGVYFYRVLFFRRSYFIIS